MDKIHKMIADYWERHGQRPTDLWIDAKLEQEILEDIKDMFFWINVNQSYKTESLEGAKFEGVTIRILELCDD